MSKELGFEQGFGQSRAVDAHERAARARALVVDEPNDELFPGATLARDQDRHVERCHPCRELEHLLHGGTSRDEVLRGRVAGDSLAQQV